MILKQLGINIYQDQPTERRVKELFFEVAFFFFLNQWLLLSQSINITKSGIKQTRSPVDQPSETNSSPFCFGTELHRAGIRLWLNERPRKRINFGGNSKTTSTYQAARKLNF